MSTAENIKKTKNDQSKKYYYKNRATVLQKCSTPVYCDTCKIYVCKAAYTRHIRSKSHENNIIRCKYDRIISTMNTICTES